jgi:Protein of unknown function (DUF2835).
MSTDGNRALHFQLNLARDEYLRYYQGSASVVRVRADTGEIVQFPAEVLRKFVDHNGVHGHFILYFDRQNKLVEVVKNST